MQYTEFSKNLALMGLLDDRNAVVLAHIKGPDAYGLCLACVNNNLLRLLDTDLSQKPGPLYRLIPLNKIKILKASSFVLNPKLKFDHQGEQYILTQFNCAKEFIKIILEENHKTE